MIFAPGFLLASLSTATAVGEATFHDAFFTYTAGYEI